MHIGGRDEIGWVGECICSRRVGNFRQKNNSAEDEIDGTKGYFRRNSGYSAEQKVSEFRSEPCHGRENTRNSVPWNKNRSIFSEFPSEVRKCRLSSTPLQVLEKRRNENDAHGEIETKHPDYLGCQDTHSIIYPNCNN